MKTMMLVLWSLSDKKVEITEDDEASVDKDTSIVVETNI
jgi:hypothetical protein